MRLLCVCATFHPPMRSPGVLFTLSRSALQSRRATESTEGMRFYVYLSSGLIAIPIVATTET